MTRNWLWVSKIYCHYHYDTFRTTDIVLW